MAVNMHDAGRVKTLLAAGHHPRQKATLDEDERVVVEPIDMVWYDVLDSDPDQAVQIIELLARAGARGETERQALRELVHWGAPLVVIERFLQHFKTSIDLYDAFVTTQEQVYPLVDLLLKAGANPNQRYKYGSVSALFINPTCPLHDAISRRYVTVVIRLLDAGANPYAKDPISSLAALAWARHAYAAHPSSKSRAILRLFENLDACQQHHQAIFPALEKELLEKVWHPSRLEKLGYFFSLGQESGSHCVVPRWQRQSEKYDLLQA